MFCFQKVLDSKLDTYTQITSDSKLDDKRDSASKPILRNKVTVSYPDEGTRNVSY